MNQKKLPGLPDRQHTLKARLTDESVDGVSPVVVGVDHVEVALQGRVERVGVLRPEDEGLEELEEAEGDVVERHVVAAPEEGEVVLRPTLQTEEAFLYDVQTPLKTDMGVSKNAPRDHP